MKKHKPPYRHFVLYWIIALALVFTLGSCHTEQRSMRKAQEYLFKHPEYSAGYCAEQYPVKDSIITKDSITYDTLYVQADPSIDPVPMNPGDNPPQFEVVPNKEPPVIKYILKTIRKDSIIYRRDGAEERRLQLSLQACQGNNNNLVNKNDELQQLVNEWKGKAKTRWWWIALLIGGAVAYTGIKLSNKLKI